MSAGEISSNIEQLAGKLRRIRLGHVDPADALVLLRDASALRQIEGEPAGGAVIRREHASRAGARPHRFDLAGRFRASRRRRCARWRRGDSPRARRYWPARSAAQTSQCRSAPPSAGRNRPVRCCARLPLHEIGGDGGCDRERRIDRRKPVRLDAGMQRVPDEIRNDGPEHRVDQRACRPARRRGAGNSA